MTIRLLSLYFGLLALAFAYRLALVTQDHNTALLAMFLATFMSFFIYYTRLGTHVFFAAQWFLLG